MCFAPLPQESLENMKKFQYKCVDESLLYNKFMSPCLNKVVNYFPTWLAPNLITLFSLGCNIIAATISYLDGGFDFSFRLKRSTCFIIGVTQLLYQLLDNLDGKQARRTGNSTPFGMLMDHGCDVFTNILTSFNLSKLLLVGNNNYISFSVFFGLILGFYMMTYEEYKIGELFFPKINGTDEGNLFIFLLGVFLSIVGQGPMCYVINEKYNLTIGQLIGLIVVFGGFSCVFNLYLHTYQRKGLKETLKNILDGIAFYSVLIVPLLFIKFHLDFYMESKWIIICNACSIFARVTIDLQIKILTAGIVTCNIMFVFSNLAFILCLFFTIEDVCLYTLILLFVAQLTELFIFIFQRAKEITDYLKIRIFCINNPATHI